MSSEHSEAKVSQTAKSNQLSRQYPKINKLNKLATSEKCIQKRAIGVLALLNKAYFATHVT